MPLKLMSDSEVRRKQEDEAKRKAVSGYKDGGKVMKPCAGCPSPAKCKAAGKCMGGKKMGKGYAMGGKVLVKGKNC